jgi:peptide/nickel transport system substrate-binding protein
VAVAVLMAWLPVGSVVAKDSVSIGMRLEPAPGLDPTTGAAAAISQVTLYNIFEGLTRLDGGGGVLPLLAKSWDISDDGTTYTFSLEEGVTYHNGSSFDSADVKAQFERNAAEDSSNKSKSLFASIESIATPNAHTVQIKLPSANALFPFFLAQAPAAILDQEAYEDANTNPVGTGPYRFVKWTQGDSVTLEKYGQYRNAVDVQIEHVKFRFINDAAAQVAALKAGDLDYMPSLSAPEMFAEFQKDDRFTTLRGTTEGETILAMNNKHEVLSDVRVRRALMHAIHRDDLIVGAVAGYGTPIGSHFAPHHPAYIDLTGDSSYDPDRARSLLKEAGQENLTLSLHLPPPSYARRGGEVIAAMLAEVGVTIEIENVEWAQWLDQAYKKKQYDLTIVSHVEPMDIGRIYSNPDYYFQYDSQAFRDIIHQFTIATTVEEQTAQLQAAQRQLAADMPNGFLFQLAKLGVAQAGLTGMWPSWPAFINDIAALQWE